MDTLNVQCMCDVLMKRPKGWLDGQKKLWLWRHRIEDMHVDRSNATGIGELTQGDQGREKGTRKEVYGTAREKGERQS